MALASDKGLLITPYSDGGHHLGRQRRHIREITRQENLSGEN